MLETPHVVVGAAIAYKVGNPALALPLALGSHFVLDKVPHWNPHLNTELKKFGRITKLSTKIVITDVILSVALGLLIATKALPNTSHVFTILLASFLAASPDIVEGPYFFLGSKNKSIKRWVEMQRSIQEDAPFLIGITTQILIILAAFRWVLN